MSAPQDFFARPQTQFSAMTELPAPSMPVMPNMQENNGAVANRGTVMRSQDINPATLCRIGQEAVQDIVSRTQDIFQSLKSLQPPNGSVPGATVANERKARILELLRNVTLLMRRLRIVYDKCCDMTKDLDTFTQAESLIPLKETWDGKSEEKKQTEAYRQALAEQAALKEQVALVNQELKDAIDLQRRTVWEINTMLAMKRS